MTPSILAVAFLCFALVTAVAIVVVVAVGYRKAGQLRPAFRWDPVLDARCRTVTIWPCSGALLELESDMVGRSYDCGNSKFVWGIVAY